MNDDTFEPPPVVLDRLSASEVDDEIAAPMSRVPGRRWWIALAASSSLLALGAGLIGYTSRPGSACGATTRRSTGRSTSRTSCSGSASATPAR